jgi:hypothetical protein
LPDARVLDPHKGRTKYHLVYLAGHPLGIRKFVEQSKKLNLVQSQVRAQVQQDQRIGRNRKLELFGQDERWDGEIRQTPLLDIKAYWLGQLSAEERRFDLSEFARMHEETGWFHSTLEEGLGALVAEGWVRNLDARKRRAKNFVDFEKGERLVRIA